jgi:Fic family protein
MSRISLAFDSHCEPNTLSNRLNGIKELSMVDYLPPKRWIWQQLAWPHFHCQDDIASPFLRNLRTKQGLLQGSTLTSDLSPAATLDVLVQNIITSSAIENEILNVASVRSSLAKRLGVVADDETLHYPTSARTEGLAEIMFDILNHWDSALSEERLFQWHGKLFPDAEHFRASIRVGQLRGDEPMQVVSGRLDKPKVHFEAPPRLGLETQLQHFIHWFNASRDNAKLDPLLRAAITHFWFITLHPFDDGNGRLARALTDLALTQANAQSVNLYSMSAAIFEKRAGYYSILEQSQSGGLDVTPWVLWFCETLDSALETSLSILQSVINKRRFWQEFHASGLSPEQCKLLNRLLDGGERGFVKGISAAQYQKVVRVSKATATRHLTDLVTKGCLQKMEGGGRNTRYRVATFPPH